MERREKKRNRKIVAMFWGGESIVFLAILVLLSTFGKDWLCLYTISNTIVFVMLTVLTIAILTFMIICCKEYIKTPMFLTEGATQFTAEILYNVSNGTNIQYRQQPGAVRGHREHIPYSALSEYQLNGNIIMLLSASLRIPLNQILALGYRKDGRQQLKEMYEVIPGNEGKFEEFMFELEQIYSIDKLLIAGYGNQLQGAPLNIEMQDGQTFVGNIQTQGDLINKVERELAASFLANNETDYVLANYNKVAQCLTTPQLQQSFMNAINEIATMQNSNIQEQTQSGPRK